MNPKKPKIQYNTNKKSINSHGINNLKFKTIGKYNNFKTNKFINIDFETFKKTRRFYRGINKRKTKTNFHVMKKVFLSIMDLNVGDVVYVWNLGFVTIDKFTKILIYSAKVSNRNKRKLKWYISDIRFIPKEIQLLDNSYADNEISVFSIDFKGSINTYKSIMLINKVDLLNQCCYQDPLREGSAVKETYLNYLILTMPQEEVYQENSLIYKKEFLDFVEQSYTSQAFLTFPAKLHECYCSFGEKLDSFKH